MPAPERTSLAEIVAGGRELLETEGLGRLTMQAVADRVGVRAPSLYKRVRSRDELIVLVARASLAELRERLEVAERKAGDDPRARIRSLATAARDFAHERSEGYRLIFTPGAPGVEIAAGELQAATAPVLRAAEVLVGPAEALDAARLLTAWVNGFLGMELAGAFRLGGDVDEAFAWGIERIIVALAAGR